MFYQNCDDYMRDIFYFNGLANNPNNMYYMQNLPNQNNLDGYYPSIYRIIYPVIQRVVSTNNYQYINEELINNLVNNVLGIIEGDVNNIDNSSSNNTSNTNSSNEIRRTNNNQTNTSSANSNVNLNNNISNNTSLLKDLIKILVIKELISRQNIRRFPYNNQMMNVPYYQMPIMNSPYMVN